MEMIVNKNEKYPGKIVFTFLSYENEVEKETNITYSELFKKSKEVAVNLAKRGAKKGDRILILSTQTKEDLYSLFGTLFIGGIFILIPPPVDKQKSERFKSVLASSEAKLVLCVNGLYGLISSYLPQEMLVNVSNISEDENSCVLYEPQDDDIAYLGYTSGSTSNPKAVAVRHKNIMDNIVQSQKAGEIAKVKGVKVETMLGWVPIFHSMGLNTFIFSSIYSNTRAYIMSPIDFMRNPIRWFKAITKYKVQNTIGPQSAFRLCSKIIKDSDLGNLNLDSLEYISIGSEPVNIIELKEFAKKFEKCGLKFQSFCPGYGLSEATSTVSFVNRNMGYKFVDKNNLKRNLITEVAEDNISGKYIVSVGTVLPDTKCLIVNPETLRECNENEIGEVWLQSNSIVSEYWKQEKETEETFSATLENHHGKFLRTGDMGALYEKNLYITGRKKDLIIINGHNIYPQDIEEALKKRVSSVIYDTICSFATSINDIERVVIAIESNNTTIDYESIIDKINNVMQDEFELSPYDVVFIKSGTTPRCDNGKVKTFQVKNYYENSLLEIITSLRGINKNKNVSHIELDETEKKIKEIFRQVLNIKNYLGKDSNFFDLGGDSLDVMGLVCAVEKEFSIKITEKDLFRNLTIESISKYIKAQLGNKIIKLDTKNKNYLSEQCILDDEIKPDKYSKFNINNIFITGATGFLGTHLLKELIENTKATLYCLVRAENEEHGFNRIKASMEKYKCWQESNRTRIIAVIGDLSKPLLGVKEEDFNELSKNIDLIYHNGALLNFILPYNQLKAINVQGTIECLRLACLGKAKYFNYISTFAVYDNPMYYNKVVYEDELLELVEEYPLCYTETKLVSEKLINIAVKRGLKACIFRPSEITGSTKNGIWDLNDMVSRLFVSFISNREIPNKLMNLNMVPVDFVSKAIVHLSLKEASLGKAFNLVNKDIITMDKLQKLISEYGYNINSVSYNTWRQHISQYKDDNVLKILESIFPESIDESDRISNEIKEVKIDTTNVDKGLADSNIQCPEINKEIIFKYLDNFKEKGFI